MKRILIIGATSAIAQAVARRLARPGHAPHFHLIARSAERLQVLAEDLRARGAAAVSTEAADLADLASHPGLITRAFLTLDGCDFALIAHGVLPDQRACEADVTQTLHQLDINFLSPVSLLNLIAARLQQQGSGSIAVIGSVAGDRGRQSNFVYGSAKAGLAAYTEGLHHRLWPLGIKVLLVKPGLIDTPMTAHLPKSGPLWATPGQVADDILRAEARGQACVYTPGFWRWIMLVVRNVPMRLFRRTQL